jgi:hypothetical protein
MADVEQILILTIRLCRGERNADQIAADSKSWMPWNYTDRLTHEDDSHQRQT